MMSDWEHLAQRPGLAATATELLWRASTEEDRTDYLDGVLPRVLVETGGDGLALAVAQAGRWDPIARAGAAYPMPESLLGEALDRERAQTEGPWTVVPLSAREPEAGVLALHGVEGTEAGEARAVLIDLAPVLHAAVTSVDRRRRNLDRIRRLEAILDITDQWNQTREVIPLLVQMAEAATKLLNADRASIFIWDRANRLLVGRPALGVEGGELRIPDDRGVVGQVVQTGQSMRVDAATEPEKIDRHVDSQLDYQTETLLCVPLRGSSGELFGAFELINKLSGNFTAEDEAALGELASPAAIALENAQDREQLLTTARQITDAVAQKIRLIGESPAIEALRSVVQRVADTDLAVLVLGENGTGKEVVAQSIHYLSHRASKPFVAINCAAIPESLAESELFGHEKGAFTDAQEARQGKFELAADGTLFLDEIGDLSLSCQAKLLRVLEEKVLVRVGGSTPIHTEARVVAATNQDLATMVGEKRFREDLYFRLNVVTLDIPPLRDRSGDIFLLATHFLEGFCIKARRKPPKFSSAARKRLGSHPWPGNVRELRNLMERLAFLSTEDQIEAEDLAFILAPTGGTPLVTDFEQPLGDATIDFQVQYIKQAIDRAGGNVSQAASQLGLHRSNLYRKMRQLEMVPPQ